MYQVKVFEETGRQVFFIEEFTIKELAEEFTAHYGGEIEEIESNPVDAQFVRFRPGVRVWDASTTPKESEYSYKAFSVDSWSSYLDFNFAWRKRELIKMDKDNCHFLLLARNNHHATAIVKKVHTILFNENLYGNIEAMYKCYLSILNEENLTENEL